MFFNDGMEQVYIRREVRDALAHHADGTELGTLSYDTTLINVFAWEGFGVNLTYVGMSENAINFAKYRPEV